MRARSAACAAWILVASSTPAAAGRIGIERLATTSQGYLFVDYRLEQPFEGKVLEAIRSGLPSTLTFTVEVWRQRSGWWDRLEETREVQLRVLRDLLNDQYVLVSREEVRRFADLGALVAVACHGRREYLRPLRRDRPHYLIVTANLAPLSIEDLKELESWLQGTLRAGEASRPGGVAGLSGTMVGLLMGLSGFGDETVRGRTPTFVPEDVARAPLVVQEGAVPSGARPPAARPAPDSSRARP